MSDDLTAKIDAIIDGVKKTQDICDRNQKRLDVLDQEQLKRINEDVTKNIEEVNALKAKQESIDESIKAIETAVTRPSNSEQEICSEEKAAFLRFLRKGEAISEEVQLNIADKIARKSLLGGNESEINMYKKALVVGSNPDGGYFVRPEFADFMIERIFETSPMRQIANIQTISTESLQIPIDDQQTDAGWVGEIDARPDTNTPQVGELTIHAHEMYAQPLASQKMIDDAGFDIESWLQLKVSDRFSRLENTSFVTGDGSKKPRGFLTYPAWASAGVYERGKIEQINSGTSGSFSADNLITLQNAVIENYQPNSVFTMQRATFGVVMQLKDNEDQYLLNPNILAQGAPQILLGKPVRFFDDMDPIAADALAIAYGSFKDGYTIADRMGIRIIRDIYTNKPYIRYYTTKSTGGDVTNYESIKILKLAI